MINFNDFTLFPTFSHQSGPNTFRMPNFGHFALLSNLLPTTHMDLMQKEDYTGDSCAISPMAFLFSYFDLQFLNGHHFGIFL